MPDTQGIFTLADYTSLVGSQQAHPIVVDTIRDCMPLFDQATIQPANDGTNNKTDLITKYPEGQLRGFNQGVEPEKAEGKTVTDSCMLVSTYSQIDEKLLQLNKNSATWRANKERAFMRGLAYGMAKRFFYGSMAQDPRAINGLAARYWTVDTAKDMVAEQVIDAGGTGNTNTSIWLVTWGPETTYLFYPEGAKAGLEAYDRGIESVLDAQGRRYRAAITDYDWYLGLAVSNPASVVRIANIDVTQLKNDAASGANLIDLLIDAKERLGDDVVGRTAFYANGDITRVLRHQINKTTNSQLTWDTVAGRKVTVFDDTPIHKMPKGILLSTEARVI